MLPPHWLTDPVTIEAHTGPTPTGHAYGTPTSTTGRVEHTRRLIRRPQAAAVVSTTTVYLAPDAVAAIPTRSRVTIPTPGGGTRTTTVLAATLHTAPGVPTAPEHWEVACE